MPRVAPWVGPTLASMGSDGLARLVSIQVGLPTEYRADGAPYRTAFAKSPVVGPVRVALLNVAGDRQANRRVHGGPDMAVLVYGARHYPVWRAELHLPDLPYGAFAENFTVSVLDESSVCVGDVFGVGGVTVQVSQPRQPCENITRRWGLPGLTERVGETGRTGWYARVVDEGMVEAGEPFVLLDRPAPEWPIERAAVVIRERRARPDEAAALAGLAGLSAGWRRTLAAVHA